MAGLNEKQCASVGATVLSVLGFLCLLTLGLQLGRSAASAQWHWERPGGPAGEDHAPQGHGRHGAEFGSAEEKPLQDDDPSKVVQDLFQLGHAATQAMDQVAQEALGFTLEEERALGREAHAALMADRRVSRDRSRRARIERLIRPVLARRERKGIRYTVTVVQDDSFAAFSMLGGYIYVHTGLMDALPSDAALQFVLAHEVAHVDLKHCASNLTYTIRAQQVGGEAMGAIAGLAHMAVKLGYSESGEYDSDEWAYRVLRALGRSRAQALEGPTFLARLDAASSRSKKQGGTPGSGVESTVKREVRAHLRSHPHGAARLRRLRALER